MGGLRLIMFFFIGEFSMEYKAHAPVMPNVQREMSDAYRKKQLDRN